MSEHLTVAFSIEKPPRSGATFMHEQAYCTIRDAHGSRTPGQTMKGNPHQP
jgi:hypothetical protein